jgi:hypothetical protein
LIALETRLLTKRDSDEGLRFAKRCSTHSSSASSSGSIDGRSVRLDELHPLQQSIATLLQSASVLAGIRSTLFALAEAARFALRQKLVARPDRSVARQQCCRA